MKVILTCAQCGYKEYSRPNADLINKIKMWNHLRKEHVATAQRIMEKHDMVPDYFYRETTVAA